MKAYIILTLIVIALIVGFGIASQPLTPIDKTYYTGINGTSFFVIYKDYTGHYIEKPVSIDTWYATNFGSRPQHIVDTF
jgi:hypothetical protein